MDDRIAHAAHGREEVIRTRRRHESGQTTHEAESNVRRFAGVVDCRFSVVIFSTTGEAQPTDNRQRAKRRNSKYLRLKFVPLKFGRIMPATIQSSGRLCSMI